MCIDTNGTPDQLAVRGQSFYKNKSFFEAIKEEINTLNQLGITVSLSLLPVHTDSLCFDIRVSHFRPIVLIKIFNQNICLCVPLATVVIQLLLGIVMSVRN
jgi:hypothetical protein